MTMIIEECQHGSLARHCASCWQPPSSLPSTVWMADDGRVFHRDLTCSLLTHGRGLETTLRAVPAALLTELHSPCHACFS